MRKDARRDAQVILYSVQCYALHWTDNNVFLRGAPLSLPRSWGSPSPSGMKFCLEIGPNRDSKLSYGVNPKSLSHLGLKKYWVTMDRRMDRQTELP